MHGNGLVTSAVAAELVGRPRPTFMGWVYDGHLLPAKRVERGFGPPLLLFRVADVRRIAAKMDASRASQACRAAVKKSKPTVASGAGKVPAVPTGTRPGSEERVRVYEARVKRGEMLFHPEDATLANSGDGEALVFGEVA